MNYSENLQSLWSETKNYLELQKQYLMMDTAEKLTVLFSAVALAAVFLLLGIVMLLFFVIAFALWLANFVGGVWSFSIMGGLILLLMVVIFMKRKQWIVQPLARLVVGLFIHDDPEAEEEAEP